MKIALAYYNKNYPKRACQKKTHPFFLLTMESGLKTLLSILTKTHVQIDHKHRSYDLKSIEQILLYKHKNIIE